MRKKQVTVGTPRISFLFVVLLLSGLVPFSSSNLLTANATPPTAISPTPEGAGDLHTMVTPSSAPTNLCSGNCVITGGTRPGGGTNLFHSFGQFNVGSGDITTFQNGVSFDANGTALDAGLPTSNILARITGTNGSNPSLSTIYGTIRTAADFGSANLFLMNPAGFLFGPNATVNVGGMMTFTTANYIQLTDGGRFNGNPNAIPTDLLTAVPVAAFGFIGSNPGAITFEGGQLTVANGTGITLVGGDINLVPDLSGVPSGITAQGRQIRLTSAAGAGEVAADTAVPEPEMASGAITLGQGTVLDVSGNAGGIVRIRGGELVLNNATISADTANSNGALLAIDIDLTGDLVVSSAAVPALTARTTGTGDAGEIKISAKNIDITGRGFGDFTPFAVIDTHTSASGKGGNVNMTAINNLTMTGDPVDEIFAIDTGTIGPDAGQGGNVIFNAKNIDIPYASINTGDFVANLLGEEATGSGGSLTITADTVGLTNSSLVTDGFTGGDITISGRDIQINQASALSATGEQRAGAIRITADQLVVDNSQFEVDNGAGPSGGITIIGKKIEFKNGSTIISQTFGNVAAGDIKITATEHLTFSDDPNTDGGSFRPSGLFTNSLGIAGTLGNAGAIVVTTRSLEISGGARIDSSTRTSGQAGSITITADSISLSGERPNPIFETQFNQGGLASGIYSRTVGSKFCTGPCGNAGSISITTDAFDLTQGAQITSETTSTGRGGDITISAAQSVSLSDGASVTASSTGPSNAGNIQIDAGNQFAMTNSSVTTKASQASGGDIKITTTPSGTVQLTNSMISASVADGPGGGGNISIDPQYVILQNSQILAQAAQGQGGAITIIITNGGLYLPDANSIVNADSGSGVNGTVTIQSPNAPISGQIQPLGKSPLIATALLNQHCAAVAGGQFSSFTVAGRDSLPTEPGSWLASPLAFATRSEGSGLGMKAEGGKAEGERLGTGEGLGVRREGRVGDRQILSLRQIAPAGFLTQAFAVDEPAGCQS